MAGWRGAEQTREHRRAGRGGQGQHHAYEGTPARLLDHPARRRVDAELEHRGVGRGHVADRDRRRQRVVQGDLAPLEAFLVGVEVDRQHLVQRVVER
jgi:hypothetical protein